MKKIFLTLSLVLVFSLSSCGSEEVGEKTTATLFVPTTEATTEESKQIESSEANLSPQSFHNMNYLISDEYQPSDDGDFRYYYPGENYIFLSIDDSFSAETLKLSDMMDEFINGIESSGELKINSKEQKDFNGLDRYRLLFSGSVDNRNIKGCMDIILDYSGLYSLFFSVPEDSITDPEQLADDFIKNVSFENVSTTPKETEETENTEEKSTESSSSASVGESNALKQALSYLDYSAFSASGLKDQLMFEGYTEEEAQFGVDNCGADWKEQAVLKAKDYLDYSAFSESGLKDQLEYEGFTEEEAAYGVEKCGGDWMEQAEKKAKDYMDYSSFSKQGLIDQLLYEGFTQEQAEHGAAAVGY